MPEKFKIAVIGAGPAGLSAAARAAESKVSHILLEASPHPADTIFKYQKNKHVMAEPSVLPLRGPMPFEAGTREAILGAWDKRLAELAVNIKYNSEVNGITGDKGAFQISVANGEKYEAEFIVLGIGLQGNLRKLGVPGEDLDGVQYQLADPGEYLDETIVVVGAGDAAIENAVALAAQNRVIMINRNDEFARCKEGNLTLITNSIREERLECRFGTRAEAVEISAAREITGKPLRFLCKTAHGAETIDCHRVVGRLGASAPRKLVEGFGITFPSKDPNSVPQLSETYESNRPGIYVVGALGGYPLIKQAINQGYEVVETICGRPLEPADEPLLKAKFIKLPGKPSVSETLASVRERISLFAPLTTLQLREFLLDSEFHAPREGTVLFRRNDYTNSFFSILAGNVVIQPSEDDPKAVPITLGAGAFFGEMSLISGRRRSATVVAGKDCVLIESPRRSMLRLLASQPAVQRALDQVALKRVVRAYLATTLPESELDFLVEGAQLKLFSAGEVLFKEGDKADGLYLIRRGSVTVSKTVGEREVVLSYVPAGNFVGEMALSSDAPRSATVRAAVNSEAIVLMAGRVMEVMSRNTVVRKAVDSRQFDRIRANEAQAPDGRSGELITFLVGQGIGEATDVLLIDESLCVRCDNCETACAATHGGTSRLNREAGPNFGDIHVPTSCRHCEHPHCMKDCPPDAIRRGANGEVFITDACIGCGNCQSNCPYGVIQMSYGHHGLGERLIARVRELIRPNAPHVDLHAKKAVKCDMCKNLAGGAACVRACPTGAAIRVSPEAFMRVTEEAAETD
jgi:CRP-like cAMP-binding protein/thioredoxin reductase/Fe-S-cluster-containing hydrogenase component 2